MPVYEYQCESCERIIEKVQKFSDPPLIQCEECGGPLKKIISPPALVFKGSGFYITDYAKKKPEKEKSAAGKDQPSTSKDKESSPKTKESNGTSTTTPSSTPSSSSSSSSSSNSSSSKESKS
jgi:putative FmdB family regulatory protein